MIDCLLMTLGLILSTWQTGYWISCQFEQHIFPCCTHKNDQLGSIILMSLRFLSLDFDFRKKLRLFISPVSNFGITFSTRFEEKHTLYKQVWLFCLPFRLYRKRPQQIITVVWVVIDFSMVKLLLYLKSP